MLMVPPMTVTALKCSANDSGGQHLFDGIDGTANYGNSIKCVADNSGGKDLLNSIDGATDNGNSIKCSTDNSLLTLVRPVQGAARDSECANLSRDCTADDVYVHGTANDSASGEDLFDGIDGTADNGNSIKCSANDSGSKDLLNSVNRATDNSDSVKCSANDSGGEHFFDGIDGTADDGSGKDLFE